MEREIRLLDLVKEAVTEKRKTNEIGNKNRIKGRITKIIPKIILKTKQIIKKRRRILSDNNTMPNWVTTGLGDYWKKYKYQIEWVIKEHRVSLKEVIDYLELKRKDITIISSEMNKRYKNRKKGEIFTIVVSAYIAGYINGINPLLLVSIAERESRFRIRHVKSKTGDRGPFQVNMNSSAITEFLCRNKRHAWIQIRNYERMLKNGGGKEFLGFELSRFKGVRVITDKVGELEKYYVKKDDEPIFDYPLYNAVWAARTLLLKMVLFKGAHQKSRENLEKILSRYNGSKNGKINRYGRAVAESYFRLKEIITKKHTKGRTIKET